MPICENCNKKFNWYEAEEYFQMENPLLSYQNFKKHLCGECAVSAIDDREEDVYFETCEKCGKEFDLNTEESKFENHFPWYNGTGLRDHWDRKIQCSDCALEEIDNLNNFI